MRLLGLILVSAGIALAAPGLLIAALGSELRDIPADKRSRLMHGH